MTTPIDEPKQLSMGPLHSQLGARFMPLAGWITPAHYGDPESEYRAAKDSVAWMDVSFLTLVTGEGADHIEYLNRRLSQRTLAMQIGDGLRANQLNADGRMEADLQLYRIGETSSWMIAPPAVTGEYLQFVADKYVFSEDARFADATGQWAFLALFGPKVGEALAQLGLPELQEGRAYCEATLGGTAIRLLTIEFLPGATLLAIPAESAVAVLHQVDSVVATLGGSRLGFLPFDTLRVEAGTPWWGIDLTEKSIPLEADLYSAVHTNKGCYPGQETIAKIINLGHPARKLVGVIFNSDEPPSPGQPFVREGSEVGRLTSATWSPTLGKAIGLAMVRWQVREPGTVLTLQDGSEGRIVALPFTAAQKT